MKTKIIKVTKRYKNLGYEVRTEEWDIGDGHPTIMTKQAYNREGEWIGDSKWAYRLTKKYGIYPQKIKPEHCVCSIGFSEREQKWIGWSHRAIAGFWIGSTCKKGDCHYVPNIWEEIRDEGCFGEPCDLLKDGMCQANVGIGLRDATKEEIDCGKRHKGELIAVEGSKTPSQECNQKNCVFKTGKGEWTAKTLEDAKQMAIDFVESVS